MHICQWRNKVPSFYRFNNLCNFEVNKQVHPLTSIYNLHRQAINTCYTERKNTKSEAGKLSVKSTPLNFIYNWKIGGKHCCALANARKTVFAQFGRRGALIAYFPSEMKHDNKRSCFRHWQLFLIFFIAHLPILV